MLMRDCDKVQAVGNIILKGQSPGFRLVGCPFSGYSLLRDCFGRSG